MEAGIGLELKKTTIRWVDISLPRNFYKGPRPHAEDHGILFLNKNYGYTDMHTHTHTHKHTHIPTATNTD